MRVLPERCSPCHSPPMNRHLQTSAISIIAAAINKSLLLPPPLPSSKHVRNPPSLSPTQGNLLWSSATKCSCTASRESVNATGYYGCNRPHPPPPDPAEGLFAPSTFRATPLALWSTQLPFLLAQHRGQLRSARGRNVHAPPPRSLRGKRDAPRTLPAATPGLSKAAAPIEKKPEVPVPWAAWHKSSVLTRRMVCAAAIRKNSNRLPAIVSVFCSS